jgi:SWI/SNF-related matrix-associated actin-dependent regulator 1 of chromatin subfamily A
MPILNEKLITATSNRLEVYFPYTAGMVSKIKAIPSARFDGEKKCWWLPRRVGYAKFLTSFGRQYKFAIDPDVFDLAHQKEIKLDLDRSLLYNYQWTAVDFIHTNEGTCLIADDFGIGKTIEALWYAKEADIKQVLVVTPASVVYKWQREVQTWTGWDAEVVSGYKSKILNARVLIMSYNVMTYRIKHDKDFQEKCFGLVIFDESHYLKNKDVDRTLAAHRIIADRRLFLSGTPILNRPIELFTTLNMINPSEWMNYWSFAAKYCNMQNKVVYRGGRQHTFKDVSGCSNIDDLRKRLEPIMLRRLKRDVAKELPELIRVEVPVQMSNKAEYNKAKSAFLTWIAENGKDITPNTLSKLNVLRQLIGYGKVDAAVELAQEALDSDPHRKVVVYAHHRDVVEKIRVALADYGCGTIVGDNSSSEREHTVSAFQNKQLPRVLVISSAGGEGIDLFAADVIIFAEREWNGGKEEQGEGRLHRNGQKNQVAAYYLVAIGTMDEVMAHLIEEKREIFKTLIGSADITKEVLERMV